MKVGILTYHHGTNYGGVLQSLALQTAVEKLGHEVEVIDFLPEPPRSFPFWRGWRFHQQGFSYVPYRYLQLSHGKALLSQFQLFRKHHLKLSPHVEGVNALREIAPNYDAIITGSDQVWNFQCSPAYFLALGDAFQGRKIAYAPCCTQEQQPASRIQDVGRWIDDYHAISVRDAFSKKVVEQASGREARVVCDPTLLMDDDWLVEGRNPQRGEHIMVYRLGQAFEGDLRPFIARLKSIIGASQVDGVVASTTNPHRSREADQRYFNMSPMQWVLNIRTARLLLTDSYHGALFSMKYGIPFIAYCEEGARSPRLLDLAERFGIHNRIITTAKQFQEIDEALLKTAVDTREYLAGHVAESWDFLKTALA